MNIDRTVMAFAGFMIILTVALSHYHHPYWLWFTGFIGFNLLQSSFTGFCPMASILKKLGRQSGPAF